MRSMTRALGSATAVLALSSVLAAGSAARAESVLRVAMTAGDIPDWTGAPDQGYEGYRFVGFSLYDSMVEWDLSRSDVAADIRPGLAESWEVDPKDPKRWIFHLRKGVKFHDGYDWNADSAVWNCRRVMDSAAPQYNTRHHAGQGWTLLNVAQIRQSRRL
jgi:peptide/nickel transport system substrate-binding protein